MHIILTHENADFDAIASLLAAHKLYPGATPILPHRVNRNVRAFLSLYGPGFPFEAPDHLPRGQHVQRVILVDTSKLTFVRGMGKEINQVLVIDHHTPPEDVPKNWRLQSEPLGATTTMLVEAISTRLIPISPAEATLMLAGIYEDTGSVTYSSTTPRDLRAAAWLIDQGADLEVAAEFLEHPLTPDQQGIYDDLKAHSQTLEIDGHPAVISWAISPPDTEEEISTLAHKLRNLLEPSGLFIFVQIGDNTQMVARSATDDINAGAVAEHFGGGGHDRAAAALIHDRAAFDVADDLREILPRFVRPRYKVQDLMSYGVRTVPLEESIAQVSDQMLRTGHEGFPVVNANEEVVGLVTRNAVDRAMQHQLGQQPVRRIMQPGSVFVAPSDSVEHVRSLMIRTGWGQIPVITNDHIVGVVTRTDMIRLQPSTKTTERQQMAHLMEEAMPPALLALIRDSGVQAAEAGYMIYFVGGIVRDLLLGLDIVDVDLVVEGEAIELGQTMAAIYGGEVRSHNRFGTAKWLLPGDIWQQVEARHGIPAGRQPRQFQHLPRFIDLVSARTEFYEHPTALPMVARSSIKQDLHRRDFTINTLALRLDPQRWGELLDFYGGRADLEARVLRVLHSLSFVDDPTRILRAARFEARLGFRLDQRSEALIAEALPLLDRITGERIRHEFDLTFEEWEPEAVLTRLQALGALQQIQPDLTSDAWLSARFQRLRTEFEPTLWDLDPVGSRRLLHWALLVYRLSTKDFEQLHMRLKLPGSIGALHVLRDQPLAALAEIVPGSASSSPAISEIVSRLAPFGLDTLALAWLVAEDAWMRRSLGRYARDWRHVEPVLNGEDLKAMGFAPGPLYREMLGTLRRARLDGSVATREDESALVIAHFGSKLSD